MKPLKDELARMRDKILAHWNAIFADTAVSAIQSPDTGNPALNEALDWLCHGAQSVLDFGCGNGAALIKCGLRGVPALTGIDLSPNAAALARQLAAATDFPGALFLQGDVQRLSDIADASQDGILLWNILDNLTPDAATAVLTQAQRILRPGGRISVKLNNLITRQQQQDWNIRVLEGDLLDDGLLLWNQTTERWQALLSTFFYVVSTGTVYYPEHDMNNRLFALTTYQ